MADDLGFIDPTATGGKAAIALAPRPMDLAGKVVGMIDNTKEQGSVILDTLATALRDRYGVSRVIIQRKEHYSKPASQELIDQMAREVQVAIAAVGGWGSCTLCSVHDTIEFEKRGIPATVIITEAFKNAAVFQFRGKGMDGHPYIEMPHPISNLTQTEMQDMTLQYVEQLVQQLTA